MLERLASKTASVWVMATTAILDTLSLVRYCSSKHVLQGLQKVCGHECPHRDLEGGRRASSYCQVPQKFYIYLYLGMNDTGHKQVLGLRLPP